MSRVSPHDPWSPLAMLLVVLVAFACDGRSADPAPPSAPPVSPPELDAQAYVDLGVPAPDRIWFGDDYRAANAALKTHPLPRRGQAAGGQVFARMADVENLVVCDAGDQPLATRLTLCRELVLGISEVSGRYTDAVAVDPTFAPEVFSIAGLMLQSQARFYAAVDAYIASIDASDPQYDAFVTGRQEMAIGLTMVFVGAIDMLESGVAADGTRAVFARTFAQEAPILWRELPPLSQREFAARLSALAQKDPDPSVRTALSTWAASTAR